jgi:hypothetical protein
LIQNIHSVTELPLESQVTLVYTADGTIESNAEHFTRIQELFFPVNSLLTQLALQAHSPNAGIKHSASLTVHVFACPTLCSVQTRSPITQSSNFLTSLSPTHSLLLSTRFLSPVPANLISCLSCLKHFHTV